MRISSFKQVEGLFEERGVSRLFIKYLSEKQDNDKNQIYMSGDQSANVIPNVFPGRVTLGVPSESVTKRRSSKGQFKLILELDFEWLFGNGEVFRAPHAKIINYFQYPEARFSGFLKNCKSVPDALRRNHQSKYGQRVLILGSNFSNRKTFGMVLTQLEDPLVEQLPSFNKSALMPVFFEHLVGGQHGLSPREKLIQEVSSLAGKWHPSMSLKPGCNVPAPFRGNQGAGYTLEALLGVARNSGNEPDKYGFEIKAYKKGGKISLMTPTADKGLEGELPFREFMDQYGWPGKRYPDRTVFNGMFKYQMPRSTGRGTVLTLDLDGFSTSIDGFVSDESVAVVALFDSNNRVVSAWSFDKLLKSWKRKHASACYVEYNSRPFEKPFGTAHDKEYSYSNGFYICEGTSIWEYLQAIAATSVYYDPAHEIRSDNTPKVRPQWRVSVGSGFEGHLKSLYRDVVQVMPSTS